MYFRRNKTFRLNILIETPQKIIKHEEYFFAPHITDYISNKAIVKSYRDLLLNTVFHD